MSHTYKFPRPALAADLVVFARSDEAATPDHVLLIRRGKEPFEGSWAIPGGYFNITDESTAAAAVRELREETGLEVPVEGVRLVGVFSRPDRDPRERVISTTYSTIVSGLPAIKGQDDAKEARWFPLRGLKELDLAFDHAEILGESMLSLLTRRVEGILTR